MITYKNISLCAYKAKFLVRLEDNARNRNGGLQTEKGDSRSRLIGSRNDNSKVLIDYYALR